MNKIFFLFLLLLSFKSYSQTYIEISNQMISLKSRDNLYKGEMNVNSNFNPKISGRYTFYKHDKIISYFVEGSNSLVKFNQNGFDPNNINLNQLGIGLRLKPEPQIAFDLGIGIKESLIINSTNGLYELDKQLFPTINFKGQLALITNKNISVIADGLGTYFVKSNDYRGHEIGLGLSVNYKIYDNSTLVKTGYRIDYESNYNQNVSNGMFKHNLYFRLFF